MAYTSSQRSAIQQLIQFTGCDERTAVKFLKATNWKVEVAADAYFTQGGVPASSPATGSSSSPSNLNKLFDEYRLLDKDAAGKDKNIMTIDGAYEYITTGLKLDIEDPMVLAVCELLQAPSFGEFQRSTFVSGWSAHGADTLAKQQDYINTMRDAFKSDKEYFKRVYLYSYGLFLQSSKSLPLETAISCWQCIFRDSNHFRKDYVDHWIDFLNTEYKKSISRDTWSQLLEFAFWLKGEGDKGVSEYDEFGAWPSIIDSFVDYLKSKQGINKDDDTWMD